MLFPAADNFTENKLYDTLKRLTKFTSFQRLYLFNISVLVPKLRLVSKVKTNFSKTVLFITMI